MSSYLPNCGAEGSISREQGLVEAGVLRVHGSERPAERQQRRSSGRFQKQDGLAGALRSCLPRWCRGHSRMQLLGCMPILRVSDWGESWPIERQGSSCGIPRCTAGSPIIGNCREEPASNQSPTRSRSACRPANGCSSICSEMQEVVIGQRNVVIIDSDDHVSSGLKDSRCCDARHSSNQEARRI